MCAFCITLGQYSSKQQAVIMCSNWGWPQTTILLSCSRAEYSTFFSGRLDGVVSCCAMQRRLRGCGARLRLGAACDGRSTWCSNRCRTQTGAPCTVSSPWRTFHTDRCRRSCRNLADISRTCNTPPCLLKVCPAISTLYPIPSV